MSIMEMNTDELAECRKAFNKWLLKTNFEDRGLFEDNLFEAFQAAWNRRPERGEVVTREATGKSLVDAWITETVQTRQRYRGWYGLMPREDEDDLVRRIDQALQLPAPVVAVPSVKDLKRVYWDGVAQDAEGPRFTPRVPDPDAGFKAIHTRYLATTKQEPDVGAILKAIESLDKWDLVERETKTPQGVTKSADIQVFNAVGRFLLRKDVLTAIKTGVEAIERKGTDSAPHD